MGHDPAEYGRNVGEDYDELYPDDPETPATVSFLADLARGRPVLEFGIGTGRVALPLRERGVDVAGIEGSPSIAGQLAAKPGGAEIRVAVGSFHDAVVEGEFGLVALVANTIFALPTQDDQLRCFENAARHLSPGGCFAVEAFILADDELEDDWQLRPRTVRPAHVELQLGHYRPETGFFERVLVHLTEAGTRLIPINDLYASPIELDTLACRAGFRLRDRFGGWSEEELTARSKKHVSVYELSG